MSGGCSVARAARAGSALLWRPGQLFFWQPPPTQFSQHLTSTTKWSSIRSKFSSSQIISIVYLTAIDAPSISTTSKLLHPRWIYHLELSHGRSAEKGDLSISIKVGLSLWHVVGHVRYVTVPDAGPSGQQLLLVEFNDCRGWNMGLHKEHVSAPESCGIELCNNAI